MKYGSLIGTPYSKLDCWGVAREFYRLEFGFTLKKYYEEIPETRDRARELVYDSMKDFIEVSGPRKYGDLLLIRMFGIESHIAVWVGDGLILHTSERTGCMIERVSRWEKLVVGTYRIKEVVDEQYTT